MARTDCAYTEAMIHPVCFSMQLVMEHQLFLVKPIPCACCSIEEKVPCFIATGLLSVWIVWLTEISCHGAAGLISQWDSSVLLPWVRTVTNRYPFWYERICCQEVKLQQLTSLPTSHQHSTYTTILPSPSGAATLTISITRVLSSGNLGNGMVRTLVLEWQVMWLPNAH